MGVPPKTSNPDPISDPKRHFLHFIVSPRGKEGGGGGGLLTYTWVWACRPSIQILTLFQTPKDISYTLLLARGGRRVGGGVTYLHLGVGVPPKHSNPDPISNQIAEIDTLLQTRRYTPITRPIQTPRSPRIPYFAYFLF